MQTNKMTENATRLRVMIVDDNFAVRIGLRAIIGTQPDMHVIAEATDGLGAIEMFRHHQPDVTLMDLLMPRMGGVEAILAIRGEYPASRFIIFSTYHGDAAIAHALQAGAKSYLIKGCASEELLTAIRSAAAPGKSPRRH